MATNFSVGSFTKNTGGVNNEKNTISGLGFTPKSLILQSVQNTTDKTFQDHAFFAQGYSDGTNSRSVWVSSEDNVGINDSYRFLNTTKCICLRSAVDGALIAEGTVAFTAGQFEITWTTASVDAFIINYTVFGGSDLTIEVGTITQPISDGSDHHTLQGDSDFLMLLGGMHFTENTLLSNSSIGLGVCDATGQGALSEMYKDNVTVTKTYSYLSATQCFQGLGVNGEIQIAAVFGSFDATGVNLTYTGTDANARLVYYMAFKGGTWEVGNDVDRITTVGTKTITTEFKPAGVMMFAHGSATVGSSISSGSMSVGSSDGTNHRSMFSGDEHNVGTTQNVSRTSNTQLHQTCDENASTVLSSVDDVTFNATPSMDLEYDNVDGTARAFVWATVKDTTVSTSSSSGSAISTFIKTFIS